MNTRALIRELEAHGEQMGDLQRRLLDNLKSYADASEAYLGSVERHIERATLSSASVVAEAAWLLHEEEAATLSGRASVLTRSAAIAGGYRGRMQ